MMNFFQASQFSKDTALLCEDAFESLPYHRHMNYIDVTVRLCSEM